MNLKLSRSVMTRVTLSVFSSLLFSQEVPSGIRRTPLPEGGADASRISRIRNVHPSTARATRIAPAEPDTMIENLVLHLETTPEQKAELEDLIEQQSDPASPNFHKYLTPQEFAERFGVGAAELTAVTTWLKSQGLRVDQVTAGNRSILFSGTTEQVARAFQTEMKRFTVDGVEHLANATEPKIPQEIAGTVGGILRLHDFEYGTFARPGKERISTDTITPFFNISGIRTLSPGDYYNIYDINPLLNSGIDGTGQKIAVLARSNFYMTDVQSFRRMFSLKANDPTVIITNSDPGIKRGDVVETTLDTEWAGAIAPGATVQVIVSSSGAGRDGIELSALYAVNENVAPIISVSYGACEAQIGASGMAFFHSLWQQAAAQGQTVLVASGDSGAAGCDQMGASKAANGLGVNGLCSSPYSTCVGGTQFVEGSNPGQYWLPAAADFLGATAIGYIPETVWNESGTVTGGGGLLSGGGGSSIVFPKPAWQKGPGVPADGKRDVPDVSLTAAGHDGYTVVQGGMLGYIINMSGTSASTPSFAGIMALVNQLNQSPQGHINPVLYSLAAKQATGGAAIFHDIKTGNNSVPGQPGFSAAAGYDLATGLGSVDANLLATLFKYTSTDAASLNVYANALSMNVGQTGTTTVSTAVKGLNSAVVLSVSGLPTGVTAAFTSANIAAPGAGSSALKFTAASSAVPGVYNVTVTATAGATVATSSLALTLLKPTFHFSYGGGMYPTVLFGPNPPYTPQKINIDTYPSNGFNAPIAFSASGLPAGITISFAPATISGGVPNKTVATVTAANTIKGGEYPFTLTATGGGVTQSVNYKAMVFVTPSCRLTADQPSIAFKTGASAVVTLTCPSDTGSKAATTLTVKGAPGGMTASLSSNTIAAGQTVKLNLSSTNGVNPGTYGLTISGSEASGARQDIFVFAAVGVPVFSLSLSPATMSAAAGSTVSFDAIVNPDPGYTNNVDIGIGGRPAGVDVSFSSLPSGGKGKRMTLTIAPTAVPGTYSLPISATTNTGFSKYLTATLTILPPPSFSLTANTPSVSVRLGGSGSVTLTSKAISGFSGDVAVSAASLATGVTATFSKAAIPAPGNGTVNMNLTVKSTTKVGSYVIGIVGTGGGKTANTSVTLNVTK